MLPVTDDLVMKRGWALWYSWPTDGDDYHAIFGSAAPEGTAAEREESVGFRLTFNERGTESPNNASRLCYR